MRNFYPAAFVVLLLSGITFAANETTTTTVPASACLDTSAQCQSAPDVSVYGPGRSGYSGGGAYVVNCYPLSDTDQLCRGVYSATGQTFSPTKNGYLVKADLYLSRHLALLGGTIPVEVRSGSTTGPLLTSKLLNVATLPLSTYGAKVGRTTVVFDTTPYLTAGSTYAILIRSDRNWVFKDGWGGSDVYWDAELDAIQGNATSYYTPGETAFSGWALWSGDSEFTIYLSNSTCTLCTATTTSTTTSTIPVCPACSSPSAWSACVNNNQSRTNYKCDLTTNYQCQSHIETQLCTSSTASNFSLSLTFPSGTINKGSGISPAVTASLTSGTAQTVSFSCNNVPTGVSCSFGPTSCTPTCSTTMTLWAPSTATTGTYFIGVVGEDGINRIQTTFTLTVSEATTVRTCTDSDGGLNYNTAGYILTNDPQSSGTIWDTCLVQRTGNNYNQTTTNCSPSEGSCHVEEVYCDATRSSGYGYSSAPCLNGCANRACVQASATTTVPATTTIPSNTTTTIPAGSCTGLNLTFVNHGSVYAIGETVYYKYSCIPGGSTNYVAYQIAKSDGTLASYGSATGTIISQTSGWGPPPVAATYTLRVCFDQNCQTPAASLSFTVVSNASTGTSTTTPVTTTTYTPTPITAPPTGGGGGGSGGGSGGVACPIIIPPHCPNGKLAPKYDSKGCATGYECIQFTQPTCPSPAKPSCPDGKGLQAKFDNNGCVTEYVCVEYPVSFCPAVYEPVCGKDGNTYSNECYAKSAGVGMAYLGPCNQKPFCGNYRCEIGEDQNNCPNDCGRPIPPGCRVEKKPNGFERYICEGEYRSACPAVPADMESRCAASGGRFTKRTDFAGCSVPQCEFGEKRTFEIFQSDVCRSSEDVKQITKKCESLGLTVQISAYTAGGETCKVARCSQKEEQVCNEISFEVRQDIEKKCSSQGLGVISAFDERGCQILQCAAPQACQRDVPKEAYDTCRNKGGELIVKHTDEGCISFVDCVRRGDENEVFVEEVKEVPTPTNLFSIALKLEELRIEFDKLARQTNAIADYYKSVASDEEQRFRRVTHMLDAAKDKVNEIRDKLRSKVNAITTDDMLEVRHDITYIKNVMLKDIVYVMLSGGEEIKEVKSKEAKDCGSSEDCFDRAFRVCKPVTFYPEGQQESRIEVIGIEGDSCIMKASMAESSLPPGFVTEIKPPYEMTCKVKNYALGVRNPKDDVLPYCTGNLVELIKTG